MAGQLLKNDRRTPQGVRGLKYFHNGKASKNMSRTPQGVRGLKYRVPVIESLGVGSHPARGAWIEI